MTTMAPAGIDVFSSEVYTEGIPHEQFAWLREQPGMVCQRIADPELEDEAFIAARHADVAAVAKDGEHFTITDGHNVRRVRGRAGDGRNLLVLDDPDHLRLRMRANRGFTPRAIRRFSEHYRDLADRILDAALVRDRFDFVTDVSAQLPLAAICELIGAPPEDHPAIFRWSNAIIGTEDPEYSSGLEDRVAASAEMAAYTERLARERLARPRDDVLTRLAQDWERGELADDEFFLYILLLFVAGNETTRNNISHGVAALAERPDVWRRLAATAPDDPLWDRAVEEVTRWATPVIYMSRTCVAPVEVNGQPVEPGQVVAMFYPSANRDRSVFGPSADTFDIERDPNPHLSFGFSTHFCLGVHLARLETKLMLQRLVARVDHLEVVEPPARLRSSFIHGIKHLHVAVG
ncbi:MAG: cytochrome P450 [Acidimicrobiia bacterium]|nr:cytochrome P450 [Acidimicrobiia bacterium]